MILHTLIYNSICYQGVERFTQQGVHGGKIHKKGTVFSSTHSAFFIVNICEVFLEVIFPCVTPEPAIYRVLWQFLPG